MKTPTKSEIKRIENNRSAAIMLAIEISSNFKLYSYRILPHEQFTQRTIELLQVFDKSYIKPPTDPQQLDLVDEIELNNNAQ